MELGKRMTDFSTEPTAEDAAAGDVLDDDIGVAVEFEGEDEDEDDDAVDEIAVSTALACALALFCLEGALQQYQILVLEHDSLLVASPGLTSKMLTV